MKNERTHRFYQYARLMVLLAAIALTVPGAGRKPYSPREKAFYADTATVEFVRPGLKITVNSATIASDGVITVVYSVTDPAGLPLDASGITTPGVVSLSYVAAVLPNDSSDYTTYTTRLITGAGASASDPNSDSGGVLTNVGPGRYQY